MRAAERGVQVAVLVELKARFDEATNVNWAKQLERAGVHVVYGMVGLKTHSKCVLVVRDDGDQLRRYCHIGTGNYNTKTARLYEDLGILTCDPDIGADVAKLFNHLTGYSRGDQYHTLLVAPRDLRPRLRELIERETRFGPEGTITIKANSIGDADMIEALYDASQAGVQIDLVIRGISCLRAGVEGLSENIRVRSILGRYLEHSRIYRFAPRRRRRRAAVPDRVGRHDAAQPRPARRGAGADRAPQAPRLARPRARVPARRRHRALGAAARRHLGPPGPAATPSSRTPRSACTAGSSSARRPHAAPPSRPVAPSPRASPVVHLPFT